MLYDISPPLHTGMPVWPGDTPFQAYRVWRLEHSCPVNVSRFTLSTHAGAHADAPLHYLAGGMAIGDTPLEPYLGPCRLIHCLGGGALGVDELQAALARLPGPLPERVLLRTWLRSPTTRWDPAFRALSAAAIDWLGGQGVRLIGVDSPSLDPADSKTLPAHHAVARAGMAILENLLLDAVREGDYELIALPLRLSGLDASPVRAVLRSSN